MGAPRGLQRAFAFCAVYLRLETCLIPLVVGVEAWMDVLAEGEGLALDFVGTASDLVSAEKSRPRMGRLLWTLQPTDCAVSNFLVRALSLGVLIVFLGRAPVDYVPESLDVFRAKILIF